MKPVIGKIQHILQLQGCCYYKPIMGCVQSAERKAAQQRSTKKLSEYQSKEGLSTLGLEKDTTASGRNSTRYSPTIWDIQRERERRAALRTSFSSIGLPQPGTLRGERSADNSHIFMGSASSQGRFAAYDTPTGQSPTQGMIPAWIRASTPESVLERSHFSTRSNSFAGTSPSNASVYFPTAQSCPGVSPSVRSSRIKVDGEGGRYSIQRSAYSFNGGFAPSRSAQGTGGLSSRSRYSMQGQSRNRCGVLSFRVQ